MRKMTPKKSLQASPMHRDQLTIYETWILSLQPTSDSGLAWPSCGAKIDGSA